ncbi:MFS transporter [Latilactobacillus fuchuensis]|uniref:MFS transporter n=1 Tax=Latilactobacillus fuchuensis TaxID=164393 RepID=UPI0039B0FDF0
MEQTTKIWNKQFILLFITNLLMMAAFYASIPIIPIYCQEHGITGMKVGIVLTAMSLATIIFRPIAGYLLDNFNRYHVYLLFLGLFCLAFPSFILFPTFGALVLIRLYMGIVYSVCGSATMTLAGDVLPRANVTAGISRFALTISIGMAFGPYIGIQVQNYVNSPTAFLIIFAMTVVAFICVCASHIQYPKVTRKKFAFRDTIYKPALPFMFNMMFLMVPFGAVIAYSSLLAQDLHLTATIPYFYICLVLGMLLSKFSTQKMIDNGRHRVLVYLSLVLLMVTMASYAFLTTSLHLLIAGFLFGLGYGILQPLFQSFVTGTTPAPKRGVANATYMLSYDIGIGIGSFLMGSLQTSIGIANGFALTALAFVIGGVIYAVYVDRYYLKLKNQLTSQATPDNIVKTHMEHDVYTLPATANVQEALLYFSQKHISGAPIVNQNGQPVGFISDGDILRYLRTADYPAAALDGTALLTALLETDVDFDQKLANLTSLSVLEVSTRQLITVNATASFESVCQLLSAKPIKKVPVVENHKIVGIITRSNITDYLTQRYLKQATTM